MEKFENIQPPAEWAGCDGVKGTEKVYPASHLTMFIRVSVPFLKKQTKKRWNCACVELFINSLLGWSLGPDGTAEDFGGMSFFKNNSLLLLL